MDQTVLFIVIRLDAIIFEISSASLINVFILFLSLKNYLVSNKANI